LSLKIEEWEKLTEGMGNISVNSENLKFGKCFPRERVSGRVLAGNYSDVEGW